jgi:hypothetical protein
MKPLLNFKAVFKVNFQADGTLDKSKMRLVVGGHREIKGQYYDETISPVFSIVVLRLMVAIFAAYPHVVTTVADVEQVYLNSVLHEKVHVRAPPGFPVPEGHESLLLKAVYGMTQAGHEFWKLLRGIIVGRGFKHSESAHCFFFRGTKAGFVIIMTYIDDTTITSDNEDLHLHLHNHLRLHFFLLLHLHRHPSLHPSQVLTLF